MTESEGRKPKGYWTKERCFVEAQKYKNRTRWMHGHQTSYQTARRNGWLDHCSVGMERDFERKPLGYWTKERLIEEALKYSTKTEWANNSAGSKSRAERTGILDEITSHMEKNSKVIKKELIFSHARRVKSKREFRETFSGSYAKSLKKGWYNTLCELNGWEYQPKTFWTKEMILDSTKGYTNLRDWIRESHHRTRRMARKLGVYNKCVKNISKNSKLKHDDIIESILSTTKDYTYFEEWCESQPTAYDSSKRYLIKTKIRELISENRRNLKRRNR